MGQLIASAVIVVGVISARFAAGRLVRRQQWVTIEEARRWLVLARNLALLVGVFGLALVWADELRVIGVSLVAVAVAVVISTQDLIKSMLASFQRAASGAYSIGDRIVVGDFRGYVIDHSLLVTTLLEIGPTHARTGKTLSIPNNYFLTNPVANETAGHGFILHSFEVPVARSGWKHELEALQTAADAAASPYIEQAGLEMTERAVEHSLPIPSVTPSVVATPTSVEVMTLTVRVPVAAQLAGSIEQDVLRRWLDTDSTRSD